MKIHDIEKELNTLGNRVALGYERMIDFNHGFLYALKRHGVISTQEYNKLLKVHANYENGDCQWSIGKNGEVEHDPEA